VKDALGVKGRPVYVRMGIAAGMLLMAGVVVGHLATAAREPPGDSRILTVIRGLRYRSDSLSAIEGYFVLRHADDTQALAREETIRRELYRSLASEGVERNSKSSATPIAKGTVTRTTTLIRLCLRGVEAYCESLELEHGANYEGFGDYEGSLKMPEYLPFWRRMVRMCNGETVATVDFTTGLCTIAAQTAPPAQIIDHVQLVMNELGVTVSKSWIGALEKWLEAPEWFRPRVVGTEELAGTRCLVVDFPGAVSYHRLWVATERSFCVLRHEYVAWRKDTPRRISSYIVRKTGRLLQTKEGLWVPRYWELQGYRYVQEPEPHWQWRDTIVLQARNLAINDAVTSVFPTLESVVPMGFTVVDQVRRKSWVSGNADVIAKSLGDLPSHELPQGAIPAIAKEVASSVPVAP